MNNLTKTLIFFAALLVTTPDAMARGGGGGGRKAPPTSGGGKSGKPGKKGSTKTGVKPASTEDYLLEMQRQDAEDQRSYFQFDARTEATRESRREELNRWGSSSNGRATQ